MCVSRCASSEADIPFARGSEEMDYERVLWNLIRCYSRFDVPEVFLP